MKAGAGWANKRLEDACTIDRHQGLHKHLPYVGLEHIEPHTGRFVGSLEPAEVKSTTFRFSTEHVLYGRLRPYLNKALAPTFDGHCSTEIFPLKPRPGVLKEFLHYWLLRNETVAFAEATCRGARMPRAKVEEILQAEFPIPPVSEQRRIVGILDEAIEGISTAKAHAEKNLQNARAVFESHLDAVFGNPAADWTSTTIGTHIEFIDYRGKTPVKTDAGLRLITAKNVRMGFLREEPREFVAADSYDAWMTRGIPRKGDVLFTTEAPLGNVAQLDTDEKVVFAQRIIIMQPDPNKLASGFLKYMLMSPPLQKRILQKGTGATATGIKASLLRLIPISFPKSLKAQGHIVDVFDELEDHVERLEAIYQQKLDALDELKKSLLHHAFSGAL